MSLSHVYNMTKSPHLYGSDAIKDVRKYLINQIESMGLEYEIQSFERDILGERLQKHYEQIANNPELAERRKNFAKKKKVLIRLKIIINTFFKGIQNIKTY